MRPRVLVNCATSLDGKLHVAPMLRRPGFAMSRHPEDHRRMRLLRTRVDAIVIGAGNLRNDDPDLALPKDEHLRRRAQAIPEPMRVVVTRDGAGLAPSMKLFDAGIGGQAIVAHTASMPTAKRAELERNATLVELGAKDVDIGALLARLSDWGCRTVLCEGGGIVNAAFFAARAVDCLYLTLTPRILGGISAPTLVDGPGFEADGLPDAELADVERVGDELFLRYAFDWNRPATPAS